ncbi:Fungal-trans domain-containing protein [Mycena kentingensis (nom. inval.)]|nr:Fungal-trans domain-containing protein [Mycena kentingensis (nom. inval.)]
MKVPCQFTGLVARRRTYVESLEERVHEAEDRVVKLGSTASPSDTSSPPPDEEPRLPQPGAGVEIAGLSIRSMNTAAPPAHPDDLENMALIQSLSSLSFFEMHRHDHFHGESSGVLVVQRAVTLREDFEQKTLSWSKTRPKFWHLDVYQQTQSKRNKPYVFPAQQLMWTLCALYFEHQHPYLPLLHRPSFERDLSAGLHTRDRAFGGVVLLVCGIGARYFSELDDEFCRGCQFFDQIQLELDYMFAPPTIHTMQLFCLFVIFCHLVTHSSAWTVLGAAIRMAQDIGVHRRSRTPQPPTAESELWRRAFFCCLYLDRHISTAVGRPTMIPYEEFDLDLPLEVDDEHWDDPVHPFVQPSGKPSYMTFFNQRIKLSIIIGFSLDMLYPIHKAKRLLAHRDEKWEERIVTELDSALNDWLTDLPAHLVWEGRAPNSSAADRAEMFADQSATLYCEYYFTQINIHRPFLPPMRKKGRPPLSAIPSLAICTNAARSCIRIGHNMLHRPRRRAEHGNPTIAFYVFSAGMILLLNIWGTKRTGLQPHMNSAISEVRLCIECLGICEVRWPFAGLFKDVLSSLSDIGETQATHSTTQSTSTSAPNHRKRCLDSDTPPDPNISPPTFFPPPATTADVYLPQPSPHQFTAYAYPSDSSSSTPDHNWRASAEQRERHPEDPPFFECLTSMPEDVDHGVASVDSESSSWYPTQTSAAPFGYPDFAVRGRAAAENMPTESVYGMDTSVGPDAKLLDLWASAPMNLEMDDWHTYFNAMSELQRDLGH